MLIVEICTSIVDAMKQINAEGKDSNTLLREAAERANQKIVTAEAALKKQVG